MCTTAYGIEMNNLKNASWWNALEITEKKDTIDWNAAYNFKIMFLLCNLSVKMV